MQKLMKKMWCRKKGFTLVELLIVVAIIGVLAGIAIPNFLGARTRAKVAKSFADMDAIGKAEELYYIDHLEYTAVTGDDGLSEDYVGATVWEDPWDNPYKIVTSGDAMYVILGYGPDETEHITSSEMSSTTWTKRVRGAIGGAEGVKNEDKPYNLTEWYDPANGVSSTGDIGYGSG